MNKKETPKFMMIYKCESCNQESGWTELEVPRCRYCEDKNRLVLMKKNEITPELMAARLKAVTDNMMKNLHQAYESLDDADLGIPLDDDGSEVDMEKEILLLLEKAKQLRDNIQALEFKDLSEEE